MRQIKSIKNRLDNASDFDTKVNAALAEGWQLTKRTVLQPKSQGGTQYTHIMLYAELEREVITEGEKCCENCKHYAKDPAKEPCLSCSDETDKWEPVE